ncbi:MAG: TIGR00269 family protein, partial [Halobacteriaceae archaeon]
VFRRDILARYAKQFNADKLLTGHNLDDEAETALMNILEGDVSQIAKHFDASLGPFDERHKNEDMIPRAKPLRDIPEKEVALYAQLKDLPVHMEECPHASESFRGKIQDILLELETEHPGTRHSIMAGYEKLAQLAATKYRDGSTNASMSTCEKCDAPTTGDLCQKCSLLESISAD